MISVLNALDRTCSFLIGYRPRIIEADECYAFVWRIEEITMDREAMNKGSRYNIPSYGIIMGEEYRIDYLEMKNKFEDFEQKFYEKMILGKEWEHFYKEFMKGIEDGKKGPIRRSTNIFIEEIALELKSTTNWELLGRNKSYEYNRLRKACLDFFHVPGTEFDDRVKKYITALISSSLNEGYYTAFKRGIDAVVSERTQTNWNEQEYAGESDEWPQDLEINY